MDVTALKRDPDFIKKHWIAQADGSIITTVPCKVYVPKHYVEGPLGTIDENFNVVAIYGVVIGDKYSVSIASAIMPLSPDGTNIVTIDEGSYLELTWEAGSVICPNTDLFKNDQLVYEIYSEIIAKGKTPWYLKYTDLPNVLYSAKKYAGVNLGAARSILEVFSATRARQSGDRSLYYRNMLKKQADVEAIEPDIIPLRSVAFGATNTTSRTVGAYLDPGISSSLVNRTKQNENIEDLLRS